MTDDELRLAAGEMLADMTRPGGGPQWTYRGRKTWDIIRDVLAAFVAGHVPADDAEPADEAWLRSLGFGNCWGDPLRFAEAEAEIDVVVRGGYGSVPIPVLALAYRTDHFDVCERPTRGDVRALLRGLKVPAKEGG